MRASGLSFRSVALLGGSGGFAPPDSSNLVFWGRAGSLAGADTDPIGSFTDLGSVGNHATASSTARPLLKLNIVNGQSVLRFDGSNDAMAWPDLFASATTGTLVAVMKSANDPSSANKYCPWYISNGVVADAAHPFSSSGGIQENFGANAPSGIIPSPSVANAFHIYAARTRSNEIEMRWNGEVFGGLNKHTAGFVSAPLLGRNSASTSFFEGDLAEIFLYKSFLTNAQLQTLHAYLNSRYAISFTPATTLLIPSGVSGLQNWFRADDLSLADNDPVSSWLDVSGNSNNLTGVLTTRPLFKTNQYNGLPCVRYDGTDDFLIKGSNVAYAAGGQLTCMTVAKCTKDNSAPFGNSTSGSQMRLRRSGANQMNFFTGSGEQASTGAWRYALGDLNLFVWTRNAGNSTAWYQGPEAYIAGGSAGTFNSAYLGLPVASGLVFGGDICEACEWNVTLNQNQISRLYYDYFKPKWGLP